jgi:hypothetical protein
MSPDKIFDDLTYRQYCISRNSSPDITPRSWGFVYGPAWESLEERYQRDQAAAAEAGIRKDQRERIEGRNDDAGTDIFGRPMRFGS